MRRALAAALVALVCAPGASAAVERFVDMPGRYFEPSDLVAVVGDTVTWRNVDSSTHNIEADDGSFASGDLAPGATFSFTFSRAGAYPYQCTIHNFMTGRVDVFGLSLSPPGAPVQARSRAVLHGLAPAGAVRVAIEQREADGSYRTLRIVRPAPDGSFRVVVSPAAPSTYRARVEELVSEPVKIAVSAALRLAGRRSGSQAVLTVAASPAQPGAPVVLQRYVRERFAWTAVVTGRLDARSRASFRLPLRRPTYFRAVLVRGVQGFARATSDPVKVGLSAR